MDILAMILAVCGALLVAVVVRNSLAIAQVRKDLDDKSNTTVAPPRTDALTAPIQPDGANSSRRRATRRSFLLKYDSVSVDDANVILENASSDTILPAESYVYIPGKPGKQFKVFSVFDSSDSSQTALTLQADNNVVASEHPFPPEMLNFSAFILVSEKINSTGYSI